MIFNNKGMEVNVELNLGKTPSKVRNKLIKDMLNFFKECQKEHSELHCTLFVKMINSLYLKKVNINGYVLDATTEEDHKRAMLHAVFDALDMDIEKELRIYRMTQKRENRHAGDVPISL